MKNDYPRIVIPAEVRRKMIEIAREFRKEPTPGEKILWGSLCGKRLDGIKFRRQQPIGYFVVDFYSSMYRLVVEVDGPIHESQKEADAARQEILEILGLTVLRIETEIVEQSLSKALTRIRELVKVIELHRNQSIPSPLMGEGKAGGS